MTTEHSTYTDETGAHETVTLRRGPLTPHGHAVLKIEYSDGETLDCYVNTAWLRDRLNALEPRALTTDAIADEMVERARTAWNRSAALGSDLWREVLAAALTEPPARPEGAEELEALIDKAGEDGEGADNESLADYLAARLLDLTIKEA